MRVPVDARTSWARESITKLRRRRFDARTLKDNDQYTDDSLEVRTEKM
jgi:hypothetical protein